MSSRPRRNLQAVRVWPTEAVIRTFDAPEAMGINFHEVRARRPSTTCPGAATDSTARSTPIAAAPMPADYRYCFARRTHTYLDMNAGRDFEREIIVKVNVPELVRAELAKPTWKRELVALGTNTDPYQWVESRYRMMPEIIAALEEAETPISVLTKSPLVMRDVDLYERMAKRLPVSVNLSIPTLDPEVWRATEPHTPEPRGPARGGRRAAPARDRLRRPDRAADAGDQRQPRAGPADRRSRPRGRRHLPRRRRAAPPRRGPRRLLRLARVETARPDPEIRAALLRPRLPPPRPAPARHPRRPRLGPHPRAEEQPETGASKLARTTARSAPARDPALRPATRQEALFEHPDGA